MNSRFTISKNDIIEAQLKVDDILIAVLFTKDFRSIEEACMRLRNQVHESKKKNGIAVYTITNVTKGITKTIEREVRNTSL